MAKYEHGPACNNDISVSVQVAFIVAGCTHAVYCKTLQNALGMNTVHPNEFYSLFEWCTPVLLPPLLHFCSLLSVNFIQSQLNSELVLHTQRQSIIPTELHSCVLTLSQPHLSDLLLQGCHSLQNPLFLLFLVFSYIRQFWQEVAVALLWS